MRAKISQFHIKTDPGLSWVSNDRWNSVELPQNLQTCTFSFKMVIFVVLNGNFRVLKIIYTHTLFYLSFVTHDSLGSVFIWKSNFILGFEMWIPPCVHRLIDLAQSLTETVWKSCEYYSCCCKHLSNFINPTTGIAITLILRWWTISWSSSSWKYDPGKWWELCCCCWNVGFAFYLPVGI